MNRILIFFGGCSTEYGVSLQSAHAVLTHLDRSRFEPCWMASLRAAAGSITLAHPMPSPLIAGRELNVSLVPWSSAEECPTCSCWTAVAPNYLLTQLFRCSTARTGRMAPSRGCWSWQGSRLSAAARCPLPCVWTRTGSQAGRPGRSKVPRSVVFRRSSGDG